MYADRYCILVWKLTYSYGMYLAALVPCTRRVCFIWHFIFERIYVGISKYVHAVHILLNNINVFLGFFSFLHFSCTRTLFCVVPIEMQLRIGNFFPCPLADSFICKFQETFCFCVPDYYLDYCNLLSRTSSSGLRDGMFFWTTLH